jgi:hypothetical protein
MKRLTLLLLGVMAVFTASAQKVYFVYLQAETEQPFFVKMNDKVYSSTASGYLILAKLYDSTYNFNIGFPQNKWPEQTFSISVNKRDHGYLVKNFDEKGWGLFDLQTLSVQMPSSATAKVEPHKSSENKDVSVFTDILSKAADDPSLKEKPVQPVTEEKKPEVVAQNSIKKEEPKSEVKEPVITKPAEVIEQPVVKKEEPKTETKEPVVTKPVEIVEKPVVKKEEPKVEIKEPVVIKPVEVVEQPVVKKEEPKIEIKEKPVTQTEEVKEVATYSYKKSQVIKKSESSTTEGFGLVFIDAYDDGIKDTIRLLIPNPKPVVNPVIKEENKEEKKFLEISTDTTKKIAEKNVDAKPQVKENSNVGSNIKNNCPDMATEADFFKLRKKMAAIESDDGMIAEAKKYFKTKCFTTAQLKNLSSLFLMDSGKYKFFDAAYSYASDSENFISLQSELKDEYYINRFKAMLRNQP